MGTLRRPVVAAFLCIPIVCLASAQDARAWTSRMDQRVIFESVRFMPPSLRGILERHASDLRAGAARARLEHQSREHATPPGAKGPNAASRVETLARATVELIDDQKPFSEVAASLGELAHLIGDLNNPVQVTRADPATLPFAGEYTEYVEGHLDRYPLVFYGWADASLDSGEVRRFADATAIRSRRYFVHIQRAYAPDNPQPRAQRFDVRSLPFGIGSISYSRTVSDTAKVWLSIWSRAHGDLTGTPYGVTRVAGAAAPAGSVTP